MKRVFVCLVVALMVALGPVGTGYALSDAEYRDRQRKTCCRNSVDG